MEEIRSRHYVDEANWILKIVKSCETFEQEMTSRKLIQNWYSINDGKANSRNLTELHTQLLRELDYKHYERIENILKSK